MPSSAVPPSSSIFRNCCSADDEGAGKASDVTVVSDTAADSVGGGSMGEDKETADTGG
eukprot:CAMPEP_0172523528 /NCGR_PEP_ID=MMETSP1066-20121228/293710_1 /TAXON_ID=671091 /ORGANISM="Coscinodiscus wailesii, Strain CCMP2513" /LENGTH=57 /DNA_ID=CAMNT_0013306609 /DNA_START=200 /DNA_END=373 /DNA_ORIENTATION=+